MLRHRRACNSRKVAMQEDDNTHPESIGPHKHLQAPLINCHNSCMQNNQLNFP